MLSTIFSTFLALILSLLGVPTHEAPTQVATEAPASAPAPADWVAETLAYAGLSDIQGDVATVILTNKDNCGAELDLQQGGAGYGGCRVIEEDGSISILISPELQNTVGGQHILYHEVGHALGITEECGAEEFAHQWSDPNYWSYPECNPALYAPASEAPVTHVQTPTIQTPTNTTATPQIDVQPQPQPTNHTTAPTTVPSNEPQPPAPTVPSIPAYTDTACSEFQTRAEDGSCVRNDFWNEQPVVIPPHAEPNPLPEYCTLPKLGDAHAGIGLTCQLDQK